MKFLFSFLCVTVLFYSSLKAQIAPFNVAIEALNIQSLGGVQSFAVGQHNGKWLIIGGRLDGLHRRQPFAAFDIAGHNNQLIVVDPSTQQKWTAPLTSLPTSIQEQLSSTNMNFYQQENTLYFLGGYGYSATANNHTTFANLTSIEVDGVINAIIDNKPFVNYFNQITDTTFQVTGGRLRKIDDTYYLLGGQKFIGRYNPMGPNNGPGFTQVYTNAIRKFKISNTNGNLVVTHLPSYVDATNLHRRDYNAESQILPNGEQGITMFSGVFRVDADLPFLNSVTVDKDTYLVNNNFQQYYNHYHCAALPIYSSQANEMHTVFFGGIAQYYDSAGVLVQNNDVPFVNTIARVTRDKENTLAEYKLPIVMPALLGAGSEFIVNKDIPHYDNEVLKLDEITQDSTLVGYIFGGISSSAANIFFTNTGTQSTASSQIFKVFLTKNTPLSIHKLNTQSQGSLKMMVYPNPNNGIFELKYTLKDTENVKLTLANVSGKIIEQAVLKNQKIGENSYTRKIKGLANGGVYTITLSTPYETATQKIVIEP